MVVVVVAAAVAVLGVVAVLVAVLVVVLLVVMLIVVLGVVTNGLTPMSVTKCMYGLHVPALQASLPTLYATYEHINLRYLCRSKVRSKLESVPKRPARSSMAHEHGRVTHSCPRRASVCELSSFVLPHAIKNFIWRRHKNLVSQLHTCRIGVQLETFLKPRFHCTPQCP